MKIVDQNGNQASGNNSNRHSERSIAFKSREPSPEQVKKQIFSEMVVFENMVHD